MLTMTKEIKVSSLTQTIRKMRHPIPTKERRRGIGLKIGKKGHGRRAKQKSPRGTRGRKNN
jgi:hypothetical protein